MPAGRQKSGLQLLPKQEIWLCFGVYIGVLVNSFYSVYWASAEKADILSFDLKPGWIPGRRRDSSDFEWTYWPRFSYSHAYWFLGHILLSWLARGRLCTDSRRRVLLFVYALSALCDILSIKLVTFLLCQCCIVYLVALFGRRRILVWTASLVILSTLNFKVTIDYLRALCDRQGQYTALMFTMAMWSMRFVSFGVDMCEAAVPAGDAISNLPPCRTFTFFEVVSYVFYFPNFMSGPFISFRDFREAAVTDCDKPQSGDSSKPSHGLAAVSGCRWQALLRLCKDAVRVMVVGAAIEVALHWLYFSALLQEEYYLISADNMTVFSLSLVHAAFFHAKYVVFYGVTSAMMRLDGVQVPPAPCCLVIQHSSSDIWRKFDVGLYNFVKQYIYVPLGGSAYGTSWQMITSFVCFAFISFWHGMETHIYVWAAVNYIMVVMETMHFLLLKTDQWRSFAASVGPVVAAHVHLVARVPMCIISLWSMFLFLGQTHVGYNLYKKILRNGGPEAHFGLLLLAYCTMIALMAVQEGTIPIPGKSRDQAKVRRNKGKHNNRTKDCQ